METNVIYNEDCIQGLKRMPDKSVDLILTDPPYGIEKEGVPNDEDLRCYYEILEECYRILKDDSWFITFCGIEKLPEMFNNNPFKFHWMYIIYINNGMVYGKIGFNRYIPALIFKKGEPKYKQMLDIYEFSTSSNACAKRDHPTQKEIVPIRKLINSFSNEGDIVLDPFMGSGTTALACKQLNRQYIGFEISPEYCKIIEKRLAQKLMTGFFETQAPQNAESLNSDLTGLSADKPQILPLAELR